MIDSRRVQRGETLRSVSTDPDRMDSGAVNCAQAAKRLLRMRLRRLSPAFGRPPDRRVDSFCGPRLSSCLTLADIRRNPPPRYSADRTPHHLRAAEARSLHARRTIPNSSETDRYGWVDYRSGLPRESPARAAKEPSRSASTCPLRRAEG